MDIQGYCRSYYNCIYILDAFELRNVGCIIACLSHSNTSCFKINESVQIKRDNISIFKTAISSFEMIRYIVGESIPNEYVVIGLRLDGIYANQVQKGDLIFKNRNTVSNIDLMLKVVNSLRVGDMITISVEGDVALLKNGTNLEDDYGKIFTVDSVAMVNYHDPKRFREAAELLFKGEVPAIGAQLHYFEK